MPQRPDSAWVIAGLIFVSLLTGLGVLSTRPGSAWPVVVIGGSTLVLVVVGWRAWRTDRIATPRTEYFAAIYAIGFVIFALVTGDDRSALVTALIILPPIGVVPLGVRTALGERKASADGARAITLRLHHVTAVVLSLIGVFWLVTVYLAVLAPVPLVAATLHWTAWAGYSPSSGEDDPRLGFMR